MLMHNKHRYDGELAANLRQASEELTTDYLS
jgi:hypothetical protein